MDVFSPAGHERVTLFQDRETGLRAIIALHSTALGPGLGGTRFFPYASDEAALADVLRLSRAMSYKNAAAGLAAGGGKAVILGDPATDKTPELLRAYGRAVASLGGAYVTACDVGTYVEDMDVVAETCPWTTGRSPANGGAGDSGELTALGVFEAMKAGAMQQWGLVSKLEGRTVAIQGLGKVGRRLAGHLLEFGARVIGSDISTVAVERATREHPEIDIVAPEEITRVTADVFSPNAMGGTLTREVVAGLTAQVVCGGANNQLAEELAAGDLGRRGILWCPDFVANAGGVIAVGDEGLNPPYDHARATAKVMDIGPTMSSIFLIADREGTLPIQAAEALAERRMASAHPVG